MPDFPLNPVKISSLPTLSDTQLADEDSFPIIDASAGDNKRTLLSALKLNLFKNIIVPVNFLITPRIQLAAGLASQFFFDSGVLSRWSIGRNSTAESGSNAGSDFQINRFNDAGTIVDSPLTITRSTGVVNTPNLKVTTNLDLTGATVTGFTPSGTNATQLQGRNLASTAPSNGQAIIWNSTTSSWEPGTVSGGGGGSGDATSIRGVSVSVSAPANAQSLVYNSSTGVYEPQSVVRTSQVGTMAAQNASSVNISGGTIAATTLSSSGSIISSNSAGVRVQTPAGTASQVYFDTGTSPRWILGRNSSAESGSNAGSDFSIARLSDAGAFIDNPFSISRATGQVNVVNNFTVGGVATFTGTPVFTNGTTSPGTYISTSTVGFENRAASGQNGTFRFANNTGILRWVFGKSNIAEAGSSAGSDLFFNRYDDAGGYLGTPFQISRSTGLVTLQNNLSVLGTSSFTGAATFSGGFSVSGTVTGLTGSMVGNTTAQWNANQLQGRTLASTAPTSGQAIVWNNTSNQWEPGTVSGGSSNATQLQSRNISSTAPTTTAQPLVWNSTTSVWEPGTSLGSAAYTASSAYATAAQGTLAASALQSSAIGTTVQAYDVDLQAIAALTTTTYGRSLLTQSDAAATRTTLGLGSAATSNTADFATAAQGTLASTALQPSSVNTAQFNANKIQGVDVLSTAPTNGQALFYNSTNTRYEARGLTASDIPNLDASKITTGTISSTIAGASSPQWNASQLRGRDISTTAPSSSGQPLVWNTTNTRWEPGTALGSAAYTNSTAYATAAQGTLAGTALQPSNIGSTVQAYDSDLQSIAALTTTALGRSLLTASSRFHLNDTLLSAGTGQLGWANASFLNGYPVSNTAPTNGQALIFNGTGWDVQTLPTSNATQIRGQDISTTLATNGQALIYNSATSQYEPTTIASSSNTTQLQGRNITTATPTNGHLLTWKSSTSEWSIQGGAAAGNNYPLVWSTSFGGSWQPGSNALGSAAYVDTSTFATAAQGGLAASALQPASVNTAQFNANRLQGRTVASTAPTSTLQPLVWNNSASQWEPGAALGSAANQPITAFATSAQGSLASSALQPSAIGVSVQAFDSDLQAIAALTTTSFGRGLLTEASASSARTTLGCVGTSDIGVTVQAFDSDLSAIAALSTTSFGRSLLTQASASTTRATLGVLASQTIIRNSAYTVTASDSGNVFECNATSGTFTMSLPTLSAAAQCTYTFRKTDNSSNAVTITCNGSETILGNTTYILSSRDDSITIYSSGSGSWAVIAFCNNSATNGGSPTGSIITFAGTAAPNGWLICNGSDVSRTTFANLFNIIGTLYGAGNGTTTFNLPNLSGRVPLGVGIATGAPGATTKTLAQTGGEETHVLTTAEMPSHTHSGVVVGAAAVSGYAAGTNFNLQSGSTASTGSGGAHNTLPPFLALNYIIKT